MPRTVEISLPSDKTEKTVEEIQKLNGLVGLRVQQFISIKPEGDLISLEITNSDMVPLLNILEKQGILKNKNASVTTSRPLSIISQSSFEKVTTDASESIWEEMQENMNKESHMTLNSMVVMFLAGIVAVIGLVTNAVHIVIGAMVIAPGFEPISRCVMGLVTKNRDWKTGLQDIGKGYLALLAGAILASFIMQQALDKNIITGSSSYLPPDSLISYWSTLTYSGILVSTAASIAGALIIVINRSVLTAGVMIALALVPATVIIGIGIVAGNGDAITDGLIRLGVEIGIVALCSAIVFLWKLKTSQRNKMYA